MIEEEAESTGVVLERIAAHLQGRIDIAITAQRREAYGVALRLVRDELTSIAPIEPGFYWFDYFGGPLDSIVHVIEGDRVVQLGGVRTVPAHTLRGTWGPRIER